MADSIPPALRSWVMSRIRSRNTRPEMLVRSLLHRMGYRFSLRRKDLPGRPDIVLPRHRAVVFVHGCFWHRHPGCRQTSTPKTRVAFWTEKFARNVARDAANRAALRKRGWRVLTVWECQALRDPVAVARRLDRLISDGREPLDYAFPEKAELLRAAEARAEYRVIERKRGAGSPDDT